MVSSPSSSAVTIPIPGKSILKRPSQPSSSLLSRFSRFLPDPSTSSSTPPSNPPPSPSNALKRAHFVLPEIAIVYPILSTNPPSTPTLKEEKRNIEDKERERRRSVLSGKRSSSSSSSSSPRQGECYWSMDRVLAFYKECCVGCDEEPDSAVCDAFKNATGANPTSVDLSGVQLTLTSASVLSDVFTIEWGLRKLVCRECDLDHVTLKPILHSLLIPGSLSYLSIASNKRMKAPAFRLVGAYVSKAKSLQFLDVSQNNLDKKSVEYIVAALPPAPERGLVSLRMDDCQLRPAALETLCRAVRTSSLRNISLRFNRISASGAVALALMIRDYPDVYPSSPTTPNFPTTGTPNPISLPAFPSFSSFLSISTASSTPSPSVSVPSVPSSPTVPTPPPTKSGPVLPPPRHPTSTSQPVQTTYTPYVPRSKRTTTTTPSTTPSSRLSALSTTLSNTLSGGSTEPTPPQSPTMPIIASSLQGGVTSRYVPPQNGVSAKPGGGDGVRHDMGPSAALLDKVRALDSLPRLGALRTLDLKGNELRNGISYISQVLKRNRTLKVLNLSENKLDVQALVLVAEALKYNSCLEMLDLSKNPCCGPSLDGIQSLRTAFTLNTALKRLFLSGTHMNSAGAIALAEFLPESTSLLHLDLTNNVFDIAGVMALSSGLKANHVMRCLDLNIPENDDEFSRMCREIMNTCVRNTEEAAATASQQQHQRGDIGKGVWGMIEDSSLAKSIRLTEEKQDIITKARSCAIQLEESLLPPITTTTPQLTEQAKKARTLLAELTCAIQDTTDDPIRLSDLLAVNDKLVGLLARVPVLKKPMLTLQGLGLSNMATLKKEEKEDSQLNGHADVPSESTGVLKGIERLEEETPTTPRIDKGKARAEPEPEEPEKILSPAFLITESSEDEDEEAQYVPGEEAPPVVSPTDRSRIWVAEEGEVFRKGTALLGPEELEGEYDGEELRRELLEAMVERPPPRAITDEYGLESAPMIPTQEVEPNDNNNNSPSELPKPYIPRRTPSLRSNSDSSSPLQSPVVLSPGAPL